MGPVFHTGDGIVQPYLPTYQWSESLRGLSERKQMQFPLPEVRSTTRKEFLNNWEVRALPVTPPVGKVRRGSVLGIVSALWFVSVHCLVSLLLIDGERLHWNKRGERQSHTTQRGGKPSFTVTGTLPRAVEPRLLARKEGVAPRSYVRMLVHLGWGLLVRYQLYILAESVMTQLVDSRLYMHAVIYIHKSYKKLFFCHHQTVSFCNKDCYNIFKAEMLLLCTPTNNIIISLYVSSDGLCLHSNIAYNQLFFLDQIRRSWSGTGFYCYNIHS